MSVTNLHDILLSSKSEDEIEERLIELVIAACDHIAEIVNSQGSWEQIRWLTDQGFTENEIIDFVCKDPNTGE